jgi:hypothetical protein
MTDNSLTGFGGFVCDYFDFVYYAGAGRDGEYL